MCPAAEMGETERDRIPRLCKGVRLFLVEEFSPYSWAFLPADASLQCSFRGTATKPARTRVFPAASRASKRYRIPSVCPPRAHSLLDIRAAFWYGSMGRGTDL